MQREHTPGPYYVGMRPDIDSETGTYGPDVYDKDAGVFAVIDGEPEVLATPWLESDTWLLAAAPDLLLATEAWIAAADRWLETGVPSTPDESKAIYDAAVAAVKKARCGK